MPKFTVLIHANDDRQELDKTLESIQFANDILVVLDQDPEKEMSRHVAKFRARAKTCIPGVSPGTYAMDAFYPWILVLRPGETLDDSTQQRLCAWQKRKKDPATSYEVPVRSIDQTVIASRLVNRKQINWTDVLPPDSIASKPLPNAA